MRIWGAIYPVCDAAGFTREAWCRLVGRRPEFRRYPPRQARNPFTGGTMTIRARNDAAEVVLDGRPVGEVYWSETEEALVGVRVEAEALPLVREWAAELGGEFRTEPPAAE